MADINEDSMHKERERFIREFTDDLARNAARSDLAALLLKGHLVIEHFLDHAMVLVFDRKANIKNKSFYQKVLQLKDANCFAEHETAIACLLALNEIRYDLVHQPGYLLTLAQVDAIGYHLGREYILGRYAPDTEEKELLIWVLGQITYMVYYPIWTQAIANQEKKSPPADTVPQDSSSGTITMNGLN